MKQLLSNRKGFTLLELVITTAVAMIVFGAVINTFMAQNTYYKKEMKIVEIQENIRSGLLLVSRELKMAGYDPTGEADARIISATENSIRFTADLNGDKTVDDPNEDVQFGFDAGENQVTRNGQPAAEFIQAITFAYYPFNSDVELTPPIDLNRIRRVLIQLTAGAPAAGIERTMSIHVTLRNIGL